MNLEWWLANHCNSEELAHVACGYGLTGNQFHAIEDKLQEIRDAIDAHHVEGLTAEVYESAVREIIRGSEAALRDDGNLARDILCYLAKEDRWVDVWEMLYRGND